MAAKDVNVIIGADDTQLVATLKNAQAASVEAASGIKSTFEGVQGALEKVSTVFVGLAAAMAGGHAFKEMVDAAVQTNFAAQELGRQLGITATQASVLRVAMGETFVTTEQLETAASRITTTMRKNEDAFTRLGVATRDSNGNYRDTFEIMQDVNAALLNLKEGTDRNVEGQLIYGKGWAAVERSILITKDTMAEAAKTADDLNLTVGKEGLEAANRYKVAMAEAGETFHGISKTIGEALLPLLTAVAEWFREHGPAAIAVTRVAIGTVITAFSAFKNTVTIVVDVVLGLLEQVIGTIEVLGDVMYDVFSGNWSKIKADWSEGFGALDAMAKARIASIKQAAENFSSTFGDAMDLAEGSTPPQTPTTIKDGATSDYDDGKATAAKDRAEARLSRLLDGLNRELAVEAEHERQAQNLRIDGARDAALGELAIEEEAARQSHDLQETSNSAYLAQLRQFADQKYEIDRAALEKKRELAMFDSDPRAFEKLNDEKEKLEAAHNKAMAQLDTQAALEARKRWQGLYDGIGSAFQSSLSKMLSGTQSFANGMRSLFTSLVNNIAGSFAQMAARNIQTMLQQAAAGKSIRAKEILGDAKAAAAGAYKAIVGIPYVGPFLAPAAAAAAFAGTIAFDSAEGGYDIPGGVNPMTQLHEREMVLPAKLADTVRDMADGGGGATHVHHWNVSTMDAGSFRDMLINNPEALSAGVTSAFRRGHFPVR